MLDKAKADLLQYEAKAIQAEQEAKRAESLRPSKAIADTDYDTAVANYKMAVANVAVAKAAIKANQAAARRGEDELRLHGHQVAGSGHDHRPPRERRPDGGRQPERPQLVSDRQGLAADAGLGVW